MAMRAACLLAYLGVACLGVACSDTPGRDTCNFTRELDVPLDGPIVSVGTGWGAISQSNTYVQLDEHGEVIATAALPASLAVAPTVRKHALTWNGQQVATLLSDQRVTMFAADGTNQHQGPALDGNQGIVRASATGYDAETGNTTQAGFEHPCLLRTLDASGAPVSATAVTSFDCLNRFPFALVNVAGEIVFVSSFFCGGPGPGEQYCAAASGVQITSFTEVHGTPLGLDADSDGKTMLEVAYAGADPARKPGIAMHAAWTSTTGTPQRVSWSDSTPLSVAWTGAFWETVVLTSHGTIAEERLDANLKLMSAHDLTTDTSFIRAPVVVAGAHRALIAIGRDGAQTVTQVCY